MNIIHGVVPEVLSTVHGLMVLWPKQLFFFHLNSFGFFIFTLFCWKKSELMAILCFPFSAKWWRQVQLFHLCPLTFVELSQEHFFTSKCPVLFLIPRDCLLS